MSSIVNLKKINPEAIKLYIALAEAFKLNSTITEVNLDDNKIQDEGGAVLIEALKVNVTVKRLCYYISV